MISIHKIRNTGATSLQLITICHMLYSSNSIAVDIAVPAPDEMIIHSDIIVIGSFTDNQNNTFLVSETIKSPVKIGKSLRVFSPYPEMSFPISTLKVRLGHSQTILVGDWDHNNQAILTSYGACSFWPHGTPKSFLPFETVQELRSFVLDTIEASVEQSGTNNDQSPLAPDHTPTRPTNLVRQSNKIPLAEKNEAQTEPIAPVAIPVQRPPPLPSPTKVERKSGAARSRIVPVVITATVIVGGIVCYLLHRKST